MTPDLTSRVGELFRARIGREPDGVWSAPGRVNLIGEHTDYNEGFVLPFAIDRRTAVAVAPRQDGRVRLSTTFSPELVEAELAELSEAEAVRAFPDWARYPLGVLWALGRAADGLADLPGLDLVIDSDVSAGAGLSSSAAIECAVAMAANELWAMGFDRRKLVLVTQRAENDAVGAPTGIMDQSASLLGAADSALFLDCRSFASSLVPLGFDDARLSVLVTDTGVTHEHASGGYRERRADCRRGAKEMRVSSLRDLGISDLPRAEHVLDDVTFRRVKHIVTENQRVLDTVAALREFGPLAIGPLLDASHVSMRDDFEISIPELDVAVEAAQASGALGARITGGGFGGSSIALVPDDLLDEVRAAITRAFDERNWRAPTQFVVRASDGAERD